MIDEIPVHHRTTQFQRVQRVDQVQRWLAMGLSTVQIKIRAMKKWNVNQCTAHRYLWRAREWLMRMAKTPLEFHRAGAIKFYDSIISDEQQETNDRLQAMRLKMNTLETPFAKFEVKHMGRVEIDGSVSELIAAMSNDRNVRDEVLRLDREIKLIERTAGSDTNGGAAVHARTNGTSGKGGNGTNGTHEALPDA